MWKWAGILVGMAMCGCSNPGQHTPVQSNRVLQQFSASMKSVLPGQYHSDCQEMVFHDLHFYGTSDESFGTAGVSDQVDRTYKRTVHFYQDGACQILVAELNEDGNFQFYETHLIDEPKYMIALDVDHYARVRTQQYATYFNDQNFCGRGDWIIDNWSDISDGDTAVVTEKIYPEDDSLSVLDRIECSAQNENECVTVRLKKI